jgi:hypothetical protein
LKIIQPSVRHLLEDQNTYLVGYTPRYHRDHKVADSALDHNIKIPSEISIPSLLLFTTIPLAPVTLLLRLSVKHGDI